MAMKYVKAYYDWVEQTAALDDAERGRLFIAILEYARSGECPPLSGRESVLFPVFRSVIDRDAEKAESNSQNGLRGGRKKKATESELKRIKATESEAKQIAKSESNQSEPKRTEATESEAKPTKDRRQKTEDEDIRQKTKDVSLLHGAIERAKRFTPPTLAEVQSYVAERQSCVDPQGFIDYYASKGWLVGKTPMKDWKAACRNAEHWERWTQEQSRGSANVFLDMLREEESDGTQ